MTSFFTLSLKYEEMPLLFLGGNLMVIGVANASVYLALLINPSSSIFLSIIFCLEMVSGFNSAFATIRDPCLSKIYSYWSILPIFLNLL